MDSLPNQQPTVTNLRTNPHLWYRLCVLIYDLRNFGENIDSKTRLDSILDASYIGLPYFSPSEANMIKSTLVDTSPATHPGLRKAMQKSNVQAQSKFSAKSEQDVQAQLRSQSQEDSNSSQPDLNPNLKRLDDLIQETLNERLQRRIKKREESCDFRVCAAHDLAPILERVLRVKGKELEGDETFLRVLGRWGLNLGFLGGIEGDGVMSEEKGEGKAEGKEEEERKELEGILEAWIDVGGVGGRGTGIRGKKRGGKKMGKGKGKK